MLSKGFRRLALMVVAMSFGIATIAAAEVRGLILAVGEYVSPRISALEGPGNDARAIERILRSEGANDVVMLENRDVTRTSVRAALRAMSERAAPGDWVVFYYAGHGAQAKANDADESDGLDEFLVLSGFEPDQPDPEHYILDNDIRAWLQGYFPLTVNILQVADACHSGTLNRAPVGRTAFRSRKALGALAVPLSLPPPDEDTRYAIGGDAPNIVFLGASQDDELALEGPLPRADSPSRGVLTYALEMALTDRDPKGRLAADTNRDGDLSLGELAATLETKTRQMSSTQQRASAHVPAKNEHSTVFRPLAPPDPDLAPIRIRGTDKVANDVLSDRGPWASLDDGPPDLIWSGEGGWVSDDHGDRIAEDIKSARDLIGVIEKSRALRSLYAVASETRLSVNVGPRQPGKLYRDREPLQIDISSQIDGFLSAFNVAANGTVQFIYPLEGDGDGRILKNTNRVLSQSFAGPPFGVDHIVVVVTPDSEAGLRTLLSRLNGRRDAMVAVAAVRERLAETAGGALAIAELYTGP